MQDEINNLNAPQHFTLTKNAAAGGIAVIIDLLELVVAFKLSLKTEKIEHGFAKLLQLIVSHFKLKLRSIVMWASSYVRGGSYVNLQGA